MNVKSFCDNNENDLILQVNGGAVFHFLRINYFSVQDSKQ